MTTVLEGLSLTFSQESDCVAGEELQTLEIEVTDGGGGKFFVLKTDRWAFDTAAEFLSCVEFAAHIVAEWEGRKATPKKKGNG